MESFERLVKIMERLRKECPWDREQNHETLKTYLIEEAYEVLDSIDAGDDEGLKEELGDLQIQILFHALCANERGKFYLDDIFKTVSEKLIRRHPHVFDSVEVSGSGEVLQNWEQIKKQEKNRKKSMFDSVPDMLPALLKAYRVQNKAARVGFNWPDITCIWNKISEEIDEVKMEIENDNRKKVKEELGDLLFSVVNLARYLDVDPEDSLRMTTGKFIKRFHFVESELKKSGKAIEEASLEEMEKMWEQAKTDE